MARVPGAWCASILVFVCSCLRVCVVFALGRRRVCVSPCVCIRARLVLSPLFRSEPKNFCALLEQGLVPLALLVR